MMASKLSSFPAIGLRCITRHHLLKNNPAQSCYAATCNSSKRTSKACNARHATTMPMTLATSGVCLAVVTAHKFATQCALEGATTPRKRRRRPPRFGTSVPVISKRGFVSGTRIDRADINDDDCPLCKKFSKGPCGSIFTNWLKCTDENPGKDADGRALHLSKCEEFASKLAECFEVNESYYQNDETSEKLEPNNKNQESDSSEDLEILHDAWEELVNELEENTASGECELVPFPQSIQPRMEVRLQTKNGAAFFKSEMEDGAVLVVAYIQDQDGNLLAAGSRDDMDMGTKLGCVLQFDVSDDVKSTTVHAIYDKSDEPTHIYFRTELLPSR